MLLPGEISLQARKGNVERRREKSAAAIVANQITEARRAKQKEGE